MLRYYLLFPAEIAPKKRRPVSGGLEDSVSISAQFDL
jgi:hypothetical protein